MSEKLEVLEANKVAIISMTADELSKYNYKKGDTDGLVNLAFHKRHESSNILIGERWFNQNFISFERKRKPYQ